MKITGKYETSNGLMVIEERNTQVTGKYAQNGVLTGKINGETFTGIWENNGQKGLFHFQFHNDNTFTGKYKKGIDEGIMRGKWTGKKIENQELPKDNITNNVSDIKRIEYEDGNVYEGYLLNGQRHGEGIFTISQGAYEIVMEGEFKDGKLSGLGKKTFTKKTNPDEFAIYEGKFKDGELNGKGKITTEFSVQEGEFKDDNLHGRGRITYVKEYEHRGSREGEFKDGKLNGKGKKTFRDKTNPDEFTISEGEFKNDELNGIGKMTTDWFIYEGKFKDDEFHGKGKITYIGEYKHMGSYEGDFIQDKYEGFGIRLYGNGDVYEGAWKNNFRHGFGTHFFADPEIVKEGSWIEDDPLNTETYVSRQAYHAIKKNRAEEKKGWRFSVEYLRKTDSGRIETEYLNLTCQESKLTKADARLHILKEDPYIKNGRYKLEGIVKITKK